MKMKRILSTFCVMALLGSLILGQDSIKAESDSNVYYLGEGTQKKDDAGYDEDTSIGTGDVHYGWSLGKFCVSGYTRQTKDDNGNLVFLKTLGDQVQLSFLLEQDIDELNGDSDLSISEDDNGYDAYFGIPKSERTNFGYGALLVKHTDYQNNVTYIEPYTNYLKGVDKGAKTDITFFEEGDYEVALDYEIFSDNFWVFNGYTHYQKKIKFSVRNGNCMVYPFDVVTGDELVNTSFTENGFYLDLAKSRYLTIDVEKKNYTETDGGLVADTRFNKPATDGEKFTDEGVYIITVRNQYTDAETEKLIYVGTDPILRAYVTTGKDIDYIKELVDNGAVIEDDGTITLSSNETIKGNTITEDVGNSGESSPVVGMNTNNGESQKKPIKMWYFIIGGIVIALAVVSVLVIKKKTKGKKVEKE